MHHGHCSGYATYSFVSDMSTMYTGNLAHRLPGNWSFDQVQTLTVGAGLGQVEIDKNITSGRDLGFGSLGPAISVGNDPLVPSSKWSNFEEDWFKACLYYADSTEQQAVMHTNRAKISANVRAKDQFITNLATKYKVRKALILTPVIWEGMVTNPVDVFADRLVRDYYSAMEAGSPHSRRVGPILQLAGARSSRKPRSELGTGRSTPA